MKLYRYILSYIYEELCKHKFGPVDFEYSPLFGGSGIIFVGYCDICITFEHNRRIVIYDMLYDSVLCLPSIHKELATFDLENPECFSLIIDWVKSNGPY